MDRFEIRGGQPLRGSVRASGSKNSVLALMASSILCDGDLVLENAPRVRDLATMMEILAALGVPAYWEGEGRLRIEAVEPREVEAPYELVRTMRASFMVLGPLLARFGRARHPGHRGPEGSGRSRSRVDARRARSIPFGNAVDWRGEGPSAGSVR